MNEEIKQNGMTILKGNKSLKVIFNLLIGENDDFKKDNRKYQEYLKYVAFKNGFTYGKIEFFKKGKLITEGIIKNK